MKLATAFVVTFIAHILVLLTFHSPMITDAKKTNYSKNDGVSSIKARLIVQTFSDDKESRKTTKRPIKKKQYLKKISNSKVRKTNQKNIVDLTRSKKNQGSSNKLSHYLNRVRDVIVKNKYKSRIAEKLNLKGRVTLSFALTKDSKVKALKVLQSSQIPPLDNSALETIKKITAFPKVPVEVTMKIIPIKLDIVYE